MVYYLRVIFFIFLGTSLSLTWPSSWSAASLQQDSLIKKLESATRFLLTPPPKDQETCFSPDQPCGFKLIKFIESAQKSIDIAVFDLTFDPLVELLLRKKGQNVSIRLLVDRRQAKGQYSLVTRLRNKGVEVRFGKQKGVMHNKFTIIDKLAIQTGSFNYTNNATRSNQENQLYLWNQKVVQQYQLRFEEIWQRADQESRGRRSKISG